ncbi:hypothetical protein [Sinanaerobacter sp. ZZT-01]|uniref:hypothetical protein n=1 Tax=Sinanaerobacter sp. ZZT-01 TaxID=3111540 RepID=UPI002D769810|nr:hypothetical protein [Sinanaerobacter sp. ZZT-01]WRR94204.1 hypothetical protein U5921_03535 [Sinanaerobacter sp. ZZT-01]
MNEETIKKYDKVKMNDKYYVPEKNRDKTFSVITEPQEVCGTLSVWLEGYRGCYAVDGLTVVSRPIISAAGTPLQDDVSVIEFSR